MTYKGTVQEEHPGQDYCSTIACFLLGLIIAAVLAAVIDHGIQSTVKKVYGDPTVNVRAICHW